MSDSLTPSNNVREILDRILSSYGVNTRVAYAELAGMPIGTINGWLKRGHIPGDYLVQCALATGADIKWLVDGRDISEICGEPNTYPVQGLKLMEVMQNSGGEKILQRIVEAYRFESYQEFANHFNITFSKISSWIRHGHVPSDIVIVCALDTGAPLYWLVTGNASSYQPATKHAPPAGIRQIEKYSISTGQLIPTGSWYCEASLIDSSISKPVLIEKNGQLWYVDLTTKNITSGRWLVDVDGVVDIYDIARLPGNKIHAKNDALQFECLVDEISSMGNVFLTLQKNL